MVMAIITHTIMVALVMVATGVMAVTVIITMARVMVTAVAVVTGVYIQVTTVVLPGRIALKCLMYRVRPAVRVPVRAWVTMATTLPNIWAARKGQMATARLPIQTVHVLIQQPAVKALMVTRGRNALQHRTRHAQLTSHNKLNVLHLPHLTLEVAAAVAVVAATGVAVVVVAVARLGHNFSI